MSNFFFNQKMNNASYKENFPVFERLNKKFLWLNKKKKSTFKNLLARQKFTRP